MYGAVIGHALKEARDQISRIARRMVRVDIM